MVETRLARIDHHLQPFAQARLQDLQTVHARCQQAGLGQVEPVQQHRPSRFRLGLDQPDAGGIDVRRRKQATGIVADRNGQHPRVGGKACDPLALVHRSPACGIGSEVSSCRCQWHSRPGFLGCQQHVADRPLDRRHRRIRQAAHGQGRHLAVCAGGRQHDAG